MTSEAWAGRRTDYPTFRALFWSFTNPIVSRELKRLLRTRKAFAGAFVYGLALLCALVYFWPESLGPGTFAGAGGGIFLSIATVQLFLFAVLAVVTCAGSIAGERENRTDELLQTSPLSGWHIVCGKLVASLGYQFLLLIGSIPALSLCFLLGGVSKVTFIRALILAVLVQVQVGSFSLLISALCRRVVTATVIALVLLVPLGAILSGCIFGPMVVGLSTGEGYGFLEIVRAVLVVAGSLFTLWLAAVLYRHRGEKAVRTAPPIIDSPEVLEERRRNYPFYLIDPQKRPPPMPAGKNPVLEKEKRTLPIGKPEVLIRSAYVAVAISILFLFVFTSTMEHARVLLNIVVAAAAVIVPATACGAIAGERERGTWDLLAVSGFSPWQIVNAKFRVCFRYGFVVILSLGLPAFLLHLLFRGHTRVKGLDSWPAIYVGLWVLVVHILLCVLIGLFFSAIFKRTSFAALGCYLLLGAAGLAVVSGEDLLARIVSAVAETSGARPLMDGGGIREIVSAGYIAFIPLGLSIAVALYLASVFRVWMLIRAR